MIESRTCKIKYLNQSTLTN